MQSAVDVAACLDQGGELFEREDRPGVIGLTLHLLGRDERAASGA